MPVYVLFASGEESLKMIQGLRQNPDRHQNLINWFTGPPRQKFKRNPFTTFGDILLTRSDYSLHIRTDGHTNI